MDELDGRLRRATGERLSYDEGRGELVLRLSGRGSDECRLAVAKEAVRNALQSALLAADPPPAVVDDALAAGAQALVAAYDADPAAVERLARRTADQFAAARRRRRG
ncbi:hypothetical protein G6553_08245 [Nocardioides sp. IC4_145]|uniref:hypothetical protein n=1 Tax=Nocardioides sp. IC4_145 TaxID=2714037 RepID=UPI001409D751|nr:hypothetical protein [Nocardioides sp. IC4_145]NHC23160.1 hypothetical protein [Nocardioides sp. IC4_145]